MQIEIREGQEISPKFDFSPTPFLTAVSSTCSIIMNCSKRINDGLACSGLAEVYFSLGVAQIESQTTLISAPPPNVSVVQLQILGVGSDIAANVLFNGGLASLPAACLVEIDFSLHGCGTN